MDPMLLEKAMKMPPNERVALAEMILASIDHEDDEIRKTWIKEIKNRMEAVKEGRSKLLDFSQLYNED